MDLRNNACKQLGLVCSIEDGGLLKTIAMEELAPYDLSSFLILYQLVAGLGQIHVAEAIQLVGGNELFEKAAGLLKHRT